MQLKKNFSTSLSTKVQHMTQTTNKPQMLSEAFSDLAFYKYRSQSNTEHPTPKTSVKGFQIVRLRGVSRQSEAVSTKSFKKQRHSQPSLISHQQREDVMKFVVDKIYEENEIHEKLLGLIELDGNLKRDLELNHLIVQEKRPDTHRRDIRDDLYIVLSNGIERMSKMINNNGLESSHLKKAHKRAALEIMGQVQELVSTLLTAIVRVDQNMGILLENVWKFLVVAFDLVQQNAKCENEYIQKQILTELQEELHQQKKENQELYNKCINLQGDIKEQARLQKQEMNNMVYQLNLVKAEFNDYRSVQEQLNTFDNATGCLKDVDNNLKDTQKLLVKIEEGLQVRDTEIFKSMKSVIGQFRQEREGELTRSQRLIRDYRLKQFSPKQLAILSEYFNHPFVYHMKQEQELDEKVIQNILLDWFHSDFQQINFGTHLIQMKLQDLAQCQKCSISDNFIEFLRKTQYIGQLQNIISIIQSNTDNLSDLNSKSKQEKYQKQFYHFFAILFEMDPCEIDLRLYQKIKYFYMGLQISQIEEDSLTSKVVQKFSWHNFIINNLADLCTQIFPDYVDKATNGQQTVIQIILFIIQAEYEKSKQQTKKILEDYRLSDKELDFDVQQEKLNSFSQDLCNHHNNAIDQQTIFRYAYVFYERLVRLTCNKMKKQMRRVGSNVGLEIQDWNLCLYETQQLIHTLIQLKPQIHDKLNLIEDLQIINSEVIGLLKITHLEKRESTIKKKQ